MRRKIEKKVSDKYGKDQFQFRLTEPRLWVHSAQSLFLAASLLHEKVEEFGNILQGKIECDEENRLSHPGLYVHQTFMLLIGLALENVIKGLCVKKEGAFDKNKKFKFTSHRLLDLIKKTGISISKQENDLLERLEVFIYWAGKYPSPLNYKDLLPRTSSNGKGWSPLTIMLGSDYDVASGLYERLASELLDHKKIDKQ